MDIEKSAHGIDKQWVVLNDLASLLLRQGKDVPEEVFSRLRVAKGIISYYLLDEHAPFSILLKANNELSKVQSILFPLCERDVAEEYLEKLNKAITGELDVDFPLDRNFFDREIRKRDNIQSIRIRLDGELPPEILSKLSEGYGVIFQYSEELDNCIVIQGEENRVKNALKNFSTLWRFLKDSD
ncbi:MAG TPA: DUF2096 domain-containing protein [Methanococcaceae archaeon]|uniref:DUF2096 domain-containing protein n=1 Tax=Methanothermococcus okinawensis TaxID=155863 RepID=A0A832ZKS9_9EURY|nr:DUF2096 domain-containing protein [Methanococcaceae archaeon]HIP91317.1 DUF2096 domain-containing protein [Methanothermococcus okinawensis]